MHYIILSKFAKIARTVLRCDNTINCNRCLLIIISVAHWFTGIIFHAELLHHIKKNSKLAKLRNKFLHSDQMRCVQCTWLILKYMYNFIPDQTCDDGTDCPFSRLMTLDSNLVLCKDIFNIPTSSIQGFVDFTNDYYGSDHPKGTRIVFVNGN